MSKKTNRNRDSPEKLLRELIELVDRSGGIVRLKNGTCVPRVARQAGWLAEIYQRACHLLAQGALVSHAEAETDDLDKLYDTEDDVDWNWDADDDADDDDSSADDD